MCTEKLIRIEPMAESSRCWGPVTGECAAMSEPALVTVREYRERPLSGALAINSVDTDLAP